MTVYNEKGHISNSSSYAIAQNEEGLIYIANSGGLIQFDGVNWEVFLKDIPSAVTGVTLLGERAYTVSRTEYGYLEPNDQGILTYHSLVSRTKDLVTDIGTFFYVDRLEDKIVYWSFTDIIVYDPVKDEFTIHSAEKFSRGMQVGDDYYIVDWDKGLMKLTEDGLRDAPLSEEFLDLKINYLTPFEDGALLVVTAFDGLFIYTDNKLEKWQTEIEAFEKNANLYTAISIQNQYFAIGSRDAGLVIIDKKGRLIQKIDESMGLPGGAVWDLMLDREGNLWVTSWSGITQIILNSPFTAIDERHGIKGTIAQIKRHQDKIYVSTDQGLYYKSDAAPWQKLNSHLPFKAVSGTAGSTYVLLPKGGDLIMGSARGIFLVEDNQLAPLYTSENFWAGIALRDTDQMILGSVEGHLHLVEKVNGHWRHTTQLEGFSNQIDFIEEGDNGELWVADSEAGVFKVVLNKEKNNILSVSYYDDNHGLPDKIGNRVYKVNEKVIFSTSNGIYRYNEADDNFVPIQKYNLPLEDNNVFRFAEADNGNIYTVGGKGKGLLKRTNESFEFERTPFQQIWYSNSAYATSLGTDKFWIGGDGIKLYDPSVPFSPVKGFKAFIRSTKVITKNDSLLFGGMGSKEGSELTIDDNGLEFGYTALFYEKPELVDFQSKLEGYDEDWSDWTNETSRQYHNLRHGAYTFKVRPRNLYAQVGDVAEYTFTILTPWYLTWWAYTLYAILVITLVRAIVRLNVKRLEKEKEALEQTVLERTEEIRQQKDEIEEQADRLRELDKVKSRFFANISHELRTPLTLINAPLESLVHNGKIEDSEVRQTLETATRNGVSLLSLVEEILDLAKLEGGKLELIENPVRLNDFLELLISDYKAGVDHKSIQIKYSFYPKEDLAILIDERRCAKIINNLLSNALKFTPEGGSISVTVDEDIEDDLLFIKVADTGVGIHPIDLPKVFDRYYQSEQPGKKAEGGTGIGLALAKELAELHGGKLSVESQLEKGSTFILTLPLKEVLEETIVPLSQVEDKELGLALNTTIERYTEKFEVDRPVLLVTEDHPEMRAFIAQTLAPYFEIKQAENGKIALDILKNERIDIVVSDVMMPVMDGFELLEAIKKDEALHQVSLIMLTARADHDDKLYALTLGIDDYLTKPFSASEFLARIKNILDNRIKIIRELSGKSSKLDLKELALKFDLVEREVEVLNLLAKRYSNPQIAEALFISRNTVKFHIKNIFGKLGISSRLEVAEKVSPLVD